MPKVQRTMMRAVSALNNAVYRGSGGRLMGRVRGAPVLLLTVAGRKSGAPHTTPVAYLEDAGRFVVAGSAGGAVAEPQWFRNLRAARQAEIEVGRRRLTVTVTIADQAEHDRLWARLVTEAPFFGDYQTKVERQIPLAVLAPMR